MTENGLHKGLVLIAEPNADGREVLVDNVRALGYAILEANDGYRALEILRQGRVDVAVLGENLPSLSEWEVLAQCNRLGLRTPIVLASKSWSVTIGVRAIKSGARDYLTTPYRRSEVIEVVQNAFDPGQAPPTDPTGDALRQAQKLEAVGRLAGGVVHDFNNLLTVILGYSDLLRTTARPDDPAHEYASGITKAAEEGAALTSQLLAFSRTQVVEPTILNLNDCVRLGESLIRRFLGDRVELKTELDPNLGTIRADANQIDQVIMNLAINARDAMPTGGTFTLRTNMYEASNHPPTPLDQEDVTGNTSSCETPCGLVASNEGARGSLNDDLEISGSPPNPLDAECVMGNTPSAQDRLGRPAEGARGTFNAESDGDPPPSPPVLRGRGAGGEGVEDLLPPGAYIALTGEDTGCGMDTQTLSRLFEPFFTTKRQGQGTGLGLATVHNIVRKWGGYVTVASEVGQGSRFTIYFPTANACAFETVSPPAIRLQGHETVLLFEDEPAVRNILRLTLEANGYTVLEASSPDDALYLASDYRGPIHLFISALVLSHALGTDLAKRATLARPGMNVLFIAGHSNNDLVEQILQEGHASLLQKPFTTEALLAKVREALLQREVRNVG